MLKMESDCTMAQNELPIAEEVRSKLSPLIGDLKRISDRMMEIMERTEGVGEAHHQACECAAAEVDHAEFLLPNFPEETQVGTDVEEKSGAESSEDGDSEESLAKLPQVLGEFLRHCHQ